MSRKFYTLLVRDGRASDWHIHFGNHSKDAVAQQRNDICDSGFNRKINTKIISTDDTQADIDAAIRLLNAPFDAPYTMILMTPDGVEHIHSITDD
jgi:hypothetical protein